MNCLFFVEVGALHRLEAAVKKHISGSTGPAGSHNWVSHFPYLVWLNLRSDQGTGNTLGDGTSARAPITASIPSTNQVTDTISGLDNNVKIGLLLFGAYVVYLLYGR